jgi:hypothetical protein
MGRKTRQRLPDRRADAKGSAGTPADRLVRTWLTGDDDAFGDLAEQIIAEGRDGVLSAAMRKLAERHADEEVEEFGAALLEIAETAEGQDRFHFAELVLLPIVTAGPAPDPGLFTHGLAASGLFPAQADLAFADGWRSAEALLALSPAAIRRVLLDVAAGRAPAELPPQAPASMTEGGIAVLVGAMMLRAAPPEDSSDLGGSDVLDESEESAESDTFERWLGSLDPAATRNAVVLPLCAPSGLADEIRMILEEADAEEPVLGEIIDFIETAQGEAGTEEVVARLSSHPRGVGVTLLTRSGRELDSRLFELEDSHLTADDVRRVAESCVPILDDDG